ncbi:hypothetical protein GALMADRAFT_253562 [Galerina marginata CBS 339.88]|uniref:Uncharacterized protein n=1 Tax=Galerina marginata (strain CBS 339.88) TaxID=685588 RepID=A0A067SLN4_GALM3|nr:hypothetical protein GALMADRAFT_253562 [Galerina marginata CBS 339.88]
MSFPILIKSSSPVSQSPEYRDVDPETQRLIEHESSFPPDIKQDPDVPPPRIVVVANNTPTRTTMPNTPVHLAATEEGPHPRGPIRLESAEEYQARQGQDQGTSRFFRAVRADNQTVVEDMTRGFLMLVTTPIALVGMVLYSTGMIIEGIALMMKGVGSLSARTLMRRRSPSPEAQMV